MKPWCPSCSYCKEQFKPRQRVMVHEFGGQHYMLHGKCVNEYSKGFPGRMILFRPIKLSRFMAFLEAVLRGAGKCGSRKLASRST